MWGEKKYNMSEITLRNQTPEGVPLEVSYLPEKGMNMIHFKWGDIELIDQTTRDLFENHFGGLGPLIGPHFHNRNPDIIPPIKDESLFPHIARNQSEERLDPFSHGIGRYAPWKHQSNDTQIRAQLSGKDEWQGIPLSDLEGQQFEMTFEATLTPKGLSLNLTVKSDTDSLVGIHYYWRLPGGRGTVYSSVQNHYIVDNQLKPIPAEWINSKHLLTYPLNQNTDFTFHPFPNPLEGKMLLDTEEYQLQTTYSCISQENSWQLYHPKGSSFVCVEPVSSKNPRRTNLTVSGISIELQPFDPKVLSPDEIF